MRMTSVSRERAVSPRCDKASAGRRQFTPGLDLSQRCGWLPSSQFASLRNTMSATIRGSLYSQGLRYRILVRRFVVTSGQEQSSLRPTLHLHL